MSSVSRKSATAPKPKAVAAASTARSTAAGAATTIVRRDTEAEKEASYSCQFCHRVGRFDGCGGFITLNLRAKAVHAHRNCAIFSPLCEEQRDGKLSNVAAEIQRGNRIVSLDEEAAYAAANGCRLGLHRCGQG